MNKRFYIKKKGLLYLFYFFLVLFVFFLSMQNQFGVAKHDLQKTQTKIHVQVDQSAGFQEIISDSTGRKCTSISTYNISEVTIEADGDVFSLEEAISGGVLSHESVHAQALFDLQNDICQVQYSSDLGLSEFIYLYDEYEILIRHDIFEAANGVEYLINDLIITAPKEAGNLSPGYRYLKDDGTELDLLAEDWGIEWDIKEISSTSLTIKCAQHGGQQVGNLQIIRYRIFDGDWKEQTLVADWSFEKQIPIPIQMNSTAELEFDWDNMYGTLSTGDYYLYIVVEDKYDNIHPFVRKYSDTQQYYIPFTIS